MKILFLCAVLTTALCAPGSADAGKGSTSFAGKIKQHTAKREEVFHKIDMTDRTIVVLKSQLKRLEKELKENRRVKAETEKEISELNRQLVDAAAMIEHYRGELELAKAQYNEYHDQFCRRLVHYYRMKSRPFLGLLFNSTNLQDLTRRYHYYSFLSREDSDTLRRLQESRDIIDARKSDLERKEQARAQLKRRLERKNAILLTTIKEQDRLMVRIRKEQLQSERRVKKLRQAHSYLTKKIRSLERAQRLLDQSTSRLYTRRKPTKAVLPGSLEWPIDGDIIIVRPFGFHDNIVGTSEFSAGIDIRIKSYTTVKASAAGTVVFTGPFSPTYGNIVMVDHGGSPSNVFTIYGNLHQIFVHKKGVVKTGAPIGTVGALAALEDKETIFHFEIRRNTTPVDPLKWLRTRKVSKTAAERLAHLKGS